MGQFICSIVYGDVATQCEKWMHKSLIYVMPNVEYQRVLPNLKSFDGILRPRGIQQYAACASARMWQMFGMSKETEYKLWHHPARPIWVVDVDLLFLRPLEWKPPSEDTLLAASFGGDINYLEFLKKAGCDIELEKTINSGVLWIKGDMIPYWNKWYNPIYDALGSSPYHVGECTWNAIWHDLYNQGKAEILPQEYNQIISEHGPFNARIFHLAGTPGYFRVQLMENYFKFFEACRIYG